MPRRPQKHPGGRPVTTGRGLPSARPILVRVSDEEREEIQAAADRAGQPLSTWVREQALRAAR